LPGFAIRVSSGLPAPRDRVSRAAMDIGFSLSAGPVLLLFTSTAGFHWSAAWARVLFGLVAAAAILATRKRPLRGDARVGPGIAFAVIAVLAVATRLAQARDLALPSWVDSVHHVMLVRLIVEQGALPETYAPFIPGAAAVYHWGFHAVVAWIAWLLGRSDPFDLAALVLQVGQLLNALFAVALYAAGRELFGSRRAGLLAATIGTLVLWLPAYYAAWGRFPQLEGLLVLSSFVVAVVRLTREATPRAVLAAGLLAAGLVLIHVRVALFALLLAAALVCAARRARAPRTLAALLAAGVLAAILTLPWLLRLLGRRSVRDLLSGEGTAARLWREYNGVPWDLLWSPHVRPLLVLVGVGSLAVLISLVVRADRRTRRAGAALLGLAVWCGLVAAAVNLDRLGVRAPLVATNGAAVISAFLPLSLAAGGLAAWAAGRLLRLRAGAFDALVVGLALWGASGMAEVVTPRTVLAEQADLRALLWIRDHAPEDAVFAVRVFPWLSGTFAGADAGAWIAVLADRRSILPPSLYALEEATAGVDRDLLELLARAENLDDPFLRALLHRAGVTHVYLGARGGKPSRRGLARRPWVGAEYRDGAVEILRLR
jgi:hypothetical protein